MILKKLKKLAVDDEGAVTVDWVVLTAAVVALAGTAILAIEGGTGSASTKVADKIANITVD